MDSYISRTPNEHNCKASSLTQITYPTGGYTEFEFESNYISPGHIWGGLRLHGFSNYDTEGTLVGRKTYSYENPITSEYVLDTMTMQLKRDLYYQGTPKELCPEWNFNIRDYAEYHYELHGAPLRPITDGGAPLHYLKVCEYEGTEADYTKKTVYEYQRHFFDISYYLDNYDHDTDKIFLWDPEYACDRGTPFFPLTRKTIYEPGKPIPVYEEINEYECDTIGTFKAGFTYHPIKTLQATKFPGLIKAYDFFHLFSIYDVFLLPSYDVLRKST